LTKDFLGLNKLDKELNGIFKEPKQKKPLKKTNTNPKHKTVKGKPFMTQKEKEQLTKETKKAIKSTGSAFGSLIKKIRNRKTNKLEKEYFKTKEKSEQLAHEIKLRSGIEDHTNDIERYEKELEKIKEDNNN